MPAPAEPFRFEIAPRDGRVEVRVIGYLTPDDTRQYLAQLGRAIDRQTSAGSSVGLLVIDNLTGFDTGTVAKLHAEWFRAMSGAIRRIAVISRKASVRFGIVVVKMLAKSPIQLFDDETEARRWLDSDTSEA